jgi:hypothetical protein
MSKALGRGGETGFKSNKETDVGKKKDATLKKPLDRKSPIQVPLKRKLRQDHYG